MRRANSLEKTMMLGNIEGRRRRGCSRVRWLDGITDLIWVWANSGRQWRTGKPGMLQSMGHKESDTTEWTIRKICTNYLNTPLLPCSTSPGRKARSHQFTVSAWALLSPDKQRFRTGGSFPSPTPDEDITLVVFWNFSLKVRAMGTILA